MTYLDYGATSFHKPPQVYKAVAGAFSACASPGRGGYAAAREADRTVYRCREQAAALFGCLPEQVVFTGNCTHALNIAIRTLVKPGDRVVISGFEHNAVVRPLYALGARVTVAGRKLFDRLDTLTEFRKALDRGADAAVFTHVSNVFGYILPVEAMAALCRSRGIPFLVDAAQSAGALPVKLDAWGADFIAMPGHKGLLGPQGTGLLLCKAGAEPLLFGGTGTESRNPHMPDALPERLEAGTLNVPGIAGLGAGLEFLRRRGLHAEKEQRCLQYCVPRLRELGMEVFAGESQLGTLAFRCGTDCEAAAETLAGEGVCLRAGLHCAPLAHESAGTLETGVLRASFGWASARRDCDALLRAVSKLPPVQT